MIHARYVTTKDGFAEMQYKNGEYYVALRLKGLRDNSVVMGVMFGLVGTAIASSDQSKHFTAHNTRLMPEICAFTPVSRIR
jgi:hypothetical protein